MGSRLISDVENFVCWSLKNLVSDTRYECITGGFGGRYDDEYEADEMGRARMFTSGTLSCPLADQGSILVLRVGYGSSVIPGRCESDTFCKEEYDTADIIADRCDGRSSCFIDLLPRYMSCGRMSDYMLVEYECIDCKLHIFVNLKLSTLLQPVESFGDVSENTLLTISLVNKFWKGDPFKARKSPMIPDLVLFIVSFLFKKIALFSRRFYLWICY